MKISFSTLGCPDWSLQQVIDLARRERYEGIELRFIEGDAALWKRSEFTGSGLRDSRAALRGAGLAVSCVDTSCFFHSPDATERRRALDEGRRMLALAAELEAPGIRVFGDTVQPGATRADTEKWIADMLRALGEEAHAAGLEAWLETHGDFADAAGTIAILHRAAAAGTGVVWDPANAFAAFGERPSAGAGILGSLIRHVHLKDLRAPQPSSDTEAGPRWDPVLTGEGDFPADEVVVHLVASGFAGFVSFEWEKRWHRSIEEPEVALPHFASWYRRARAAG